MLKTVSYEIYSIIDNEVLVDGLTFDEMAEQFSVYQDFYGAEAVVPCERNTITKEIKRISRATEYKNAWINYFGILQEMGNLEW